MERDNRKPFIARDTKEPLVVMGGYAVNQSGGIMSNPVRMDSKLPGPTAEDLALEAKHGLEGLKTMGLWGVVDRLSRKESNQHGS